MRLIDVDALIEAVENLYEYAELGEVLDVIKEAPTVDVCYLCDRKKCGENYDCYECNHTTDIRHAVNFDLVDFPRSIFFERARPHGKWQFMSGGYYKCNKCNECYSLHKTNYCSNCGADMRGEDHD